MSEAEKDTMSEEQYEDCIRAGGHFWSKEAPSDRSSACERCGFDPGWVGAPSVSEAEKDTREWTLSFIEGKWSVIAWDSHSCGMPKDLSDVEVVPKSALTAALEERDALRRLVAELANGDFASHEWEEWTADLRRRAVAVLAANP